MVREPDPRELQVVEMIVTASYEATDAPVPPATEEQKAALDKVPDDTPSDDEPKES